MKNRNNFYGFTAMESIWAMIILSFSMGSILNVLYMSFKFHTSLKMRLTTERKYVMADEKIRKVFESLELPWWDRNPEILITGNNVQIIGKYGVIGGIKNSIDELNFLEVNKTVENDALIEVCIVYTIAEKTYESRVSIGGRKN